MITTERTDTVAQTAPIPLSIRNRVIDCVYRRSGIALGSLTCNFVDTRLRRRLRALELDEPSDYLDYIARHDDELEQLVNAFTTNETSFFRTGSLWRYIEESLLPELAKNPSKTPQFWSAACSSGEEPYSLAMLCERQFARCVTKPRIHATDISTEILEKAARGLYRGRTINRLKLSRSDMLNEFFAVSKGDFQIVPAIRKLVKFEQHNLMDEPAEHNRYDLVLLRNVLIYFSQADQARILRNITSTIRPGGMLAIGESESLAFCDSDLEFVKPFLYRRPDHA